MLSALLIVFREVIEAGLIVGIVLAATAGVPRRSTFVALGVLGGVIGACLVALFAGELASLFQGSGQELFNASILFLAVAMLTWHNVWMASHGRDMARELKAAGHEVISGKRTLAALSIVVGVAVLREGSEVVLVLYGIVAQGGTSHAALAAGMAAQAVLFLQNGGYINALTDTLWNTSWLLPEDGIAGRLLHTLVGYSEAPNGAQLIAYLATIALMIVLMRTMGKTGPRPVRAAQPAE